MKIFNLSTEQSDRSHEFLRFRLEYPVLDRKALREIKREKIDLISGIGNANSIRDYGGLWGVFGLYLLEGARVLKCKHAEMIDVTPREEFQAKVDELRNSMDIMVQMTEADFRNPDLFKSLTSVEVSLLYDVLLHQDNVGEVIKNVLSRTSKCVCVAQPVLKEELFNLPNATVNLQFYPEDLKDLLRKESWWPKEPAVDQFNTAYWMWGQTVSYLISVFYGYGWNQSFLEVFPMSKYWNYAMIRFYPRQK